MWQWKQTVKNIPDDLEKDQQDKRLAKLLFRAAAFILVAYTVLMFIRLSLAPRHTHGLVAMVMTYLVVLTTMVMSHYQIKVRATGHLLLFVFTVVILFRSYVAGGTDSPVLIIAILVPVVAIFLLGRMAGMLYASILTVAMVVFIVLRLSGHEFPDTQIHGKILGAMQSVVVIFVLSACTGVAWLYARHNETLAKTLLDQTRRDHLTGVPNRRAFDYALKNEIKRAKRQQHSLTLFMVDLDHFKSFNDLYGHHEGDECLIQVATIIQSCLRRSGDMVARYGGEEFAVILPDTSMLQAKQLAETMRHAVMGLNIEHQDSPQKAVTITLGISDLDIDKEVQPEELIKQADEALYAGKEAGRNRVCVAASDCDALSQGDLTP
jgi:diguanylate cyclase (GGDEF)-like protein